jgi:hypothetical protein
MIFFSSAMFAAAEDSNTPRPFGSAVSDAVAQKLINQGFTPEFLYATGGADGFPYTITLTLPKTSESFFHIDTLVIAGSQDESAAGVMFEFIERVNAWERPVNVVFVFAANDVSAINSSDSAFWGSKKFIDTIENPDSVCAFVLIPQSGGIMPRIVPAVSRKERITLTPLWLLKAVPFKLYAPSLFYRVDFIKADERIKLFALNGIAAAGIIFDEDAPQNELFSGMLKFIESLPLLDFLQNEGNYVSIRNPSSQNDFFFREQEYALFFLLCVVVSLILFCIKPSPLNGIAFALLVSSCIEPSFLFPALVMHIFFMFADLSKKKARFAFLSINALVAGFFLFGIIYITESAKQPLPDQRIIAPNNAAQAFLTAEQTSLLEHESIIITARAELPIIKCDVFIVSTNDNPLYSSVFPISIDAETHTAHFELEEYPPNPLIVRYLTAKNQHAVIGADFFLDAGSEGIITKRVEIELPLNQSADG